MSAAHRSARPKGYMRWSPPPETAEIVEQAKAVLTEYSSYGPMIGSRVKDAINEIKENLS